MDKLIVPEDALPYINELRAIIRTGVAAAFLEPSELINLPVVVQESGADATDARRAHAFAVVLERVVRQRLEGKDAETAQILFGFGKWAGVPLQDRYRAVARLFNKHWTWENYRKEPLTRHLMAVYLALVREPELTGKSGIPLARNGLVGQDWAMDSIESQYTFPAKPGDPLTTVHVRRIRCIVQEANVWRYRLRWRERGTPRPPEVSLLGEGTVRSVEDFAIDSGVHVLVTDVTFPRTLTFGESITFTLLVKLPVVYDRIARDNPIDWYGLLPLATPLKDAKIGLRFAPNMLPKSVWVHDDIVDGLTRPRKPGKVQMLSLDGGNYVEHTWSDLPAGHSCGISLEW